MSPELQWLWKRTGSLRPVLWAQLCAVLGSSLLGLLDPLIIKWLIDDVLPWHKESMLVVVAVTFAGVYFFRFGFSSLGLLLDAFLSQRLMLQIRLLLLRHVQRLSADYFVVTPPGDILHRLESDVNQLRELGGGTLASVIRILVSTSLTLVILMILSWRLALCVLVLVPLVLVVRQLALPRLRSASDAVVANSSQRVAFLQDHIQSIPQVQLLRREAGERRRFVGIAREGVGLAVRRRGLELLIEHNTSMAMMIATAIVLGYGGHQVLAGSLTVGGLVAFYTYLSRIFGPAQTLVSLYSALHRAQASIRRLVSLLDTEPSIVDPAAPRPLDAHGPLAAELDDVRFAYGDETVLDGVSLQIPAGAKAALVGFTGSGKSTIARLLVRMLDPDQGRVRFDGTDARRLALSQIRRRIAYVPQEPLMFDATLRENLLFAEPDAEEERLWEVLRIAQLEDTVRDFPNGLETPIGVRGQKLSGGQKQRLAIARALLQEPRFLILDEATAGLDGITEHALLEALDAARSSMTVLMIAHRLSAVRWTDQIFLLDGGRLVDSGSHRELRQRSHLYRRLCDEQLEAPALPAQSIPARAQSAPRAARRGDTP